MTIRSTARAAVCTTLVTAARGAPLASAAGTHPTAGRVITTLKQRCTREFDRRMRGLHAADGAVQHFTWLTDAHRDALAASLASDADALAGFRAEIEAATSRDELYAACKRALIGTGLVFFDLRKVRLTIGADYMAAVVDRLQTILDKADAMLDDLEGQGVDVSEWRGTLADAQGALHGIAGELDGLGDDLIALGADDFAAAGMDALTDDTLALYGAFGDLRELVGELKDLYQQFQHSGDGGSAGGGDGGATSN